MHRHLNTVHAVTVTALTGGAPAQVTVLADRIQQEDGILQLSQGSRLLTALKLPAWAIDVKPLREVEPTAVVVGEGTIDNKDVPNGSKLYLWPDPKVAELEAYVKRLEAGLEERHALDLERAKGKLQEMSQGAKLDRLPEASECLTPYTRDDPRHPDNCGFDGPTGAN